MDPQDSDDQEHNQNQSTNVRGSFKVKLGFFFGYNGQKFQGMQYQREHANTIQNTLHALLVQNGFILKSNAHELRRIKWSRAARTDKKVHALCNGISMKIQINEKYVTEPGSRQVHYNRIINDLNDQLPMDIRILVLRKVGKSFDMRHDAKTRIYNYIIPSRLFQGFAKFRQDCPIEGEELTEVIAKLNVLVKFYLGTHNFFNFTRGYKKTDPRCDRYMIQMSAQKVEQSTVKSILKQCKRDEQKQYESFIRFTLVGQSFIYHQIRKMIGLLIKIFSEDLEGQETIKRAFNPEQFDVYLAPGQGLYLNRMTFQSYNNRRDTRQKIQFTENEEQRIRKYRAYLETKIIKHEIEEQVFSGWLSHRLDWQKKQSEQEGEESDQQGNRKGGENKKRGNNKQGKKQMKKKNQQHEKERNIQIVKQKQEQQQIDKKQ